MGHVHLYLASCSKCVDSNAIMSPHLVSIPFDCDFVFSLLMGSGPGAGGGGLNTPRAMQG